MATIVEPRQERALETARILIVDDEAANVRLLERMLAQAGYDNVRTTTDPRRVPALCEESEPDLILLDLRMPEVDGFAVLQQLHTEGLDTRHVPVLVLTADATSDALQRALRSGAKDFLTKPFDHQEVLLRIHNLLETRFLHVAMRRQNEALEQQVRERTQRLLQAEKLSAMGQLLAGVAHELNNPLSVVIGQATLMLATGEGGKPRAEKIARAAERCVRIVRNFLALARDRAPERAEVNVNSVVREALELLAYELRTDGVEVEEDLAAEMPKTWADPHQLHQVLVNLLANAQHAMRHVTERRLAVRTAFDATERRVQILIADNGPGVPVELEGRIFEPFFTTKPVGQGTGLGLSLSRTLIEDHGGKLTLERTPGGGATFVVDLPAMSARASVRPVVDTGAILAGERRILVVDDEPDVAAVLVDLLRLDGYGVDTAANGAEAMARLQEGRYDAILTDSKMPVMDGVSFHAELERLHPQMARRLVFVSGDVVSPEKRDFLERIGVPSITKPFALADVRRAVREILRRA